MNLKLFRQGRFHAALLTIFFAVSLFQFLQEGTWWALAAAVALFGTVVDFINFNNAVKKELANGKVEDTKS